ncbi:NAD-dependent epimerase/dehydratase family protein [Pseudodonghicola flavimaris]|uniref:UDP-glucose 4-epimerase n=1 Tax=Pseudodonghicola flavimaris TaxID=3050036 RepID=A0ABT7EY59_9RHOB|nr:NAD-dependent epimerase/dehydratase family protein [Pseudodonghicola flavimaris]MDK3017286.1 NAD-dependent epimerase/dehydratase family protein [Pseudodonghicola flavimaris]
MKVLVIGGCGFIGSHIVDALRSRGLSLRILDRSPERFRAALPGVDYVLHDLTRSPVPDAALQGVDVVVHLASTMVPATSNSDPAADIAENLIPTVRLLEAMRRQGTRRLVFLSSGGTVYGVPQRDPIAEDHPLNPISSYGIVKLAVEKYLHMEQALHGLSYVALRASNPYGPRQGRTGVQGVIGTYLWRHARQEPIEVWGDGSVVRDFLHVGDLADLCVRAVLSDQTGVFNAGSGEGTSIREVVEVIGRIVGREAEPVFRPGRSFDVPRVVLDVTRAQEAFGWRCRTALAPGIEETWGWVRQQAGL